ncbi:MAG TPA: hypothetical protein VFG07_07350 [Thermoplasmata archaeon]|nr:hypothetical protein [Thermoplasmata archaeon]
MAEAAKSKSGSKALVVSEPVESQIASLDSDLTSYLKALDLPTRDILAPLPERRKVFSLLPETVSVLKSEQRSEAFYISKFTAACAVGLFDAALNYLWDATVVTLRDRVVLFDLTYFFDATVTNAAERLKFKAVEDLANLRDWDLIRGCKEIGLLSDIAYRQLDFIRDMRNFASAAHPNLNEITGISLVSWLETCLRNVQAAPSEGPLVELKRLLTSLRTTTLTEREAKPIQASIKGLPDDFAHSLVQAVFGMYVDKDLDERVRTNVDFIAQSIWGRCGESARHGIGIKYGTLAANGETDRAALARRFLSRIDGLGYLPTGQLAVEMASCIQELRSAHFAWDNFFNEEPHARELLRLVPKSGAIPPDVVEDYVQTLVICRLGNRFGVSFIAKPIYDTLISVFQDEEIVEFIQSPREDHIRQAIGDSTRASRFMTLAKSLEGRTTNAVFQKALRAYSSAKLSEVRDPAFQQRVIGLVSRR